MSNVIDALDGPLTAARVRQLFDYDTQTGVLRYRARPLSRGRITKRAGMVAGHVNKTTGYVEVRINGVLYAVHRLIWLYMTGEWPAGLLDHEDTDGSNNRWANLRAATPPQNGANRGAPKNNRSGVKGVFWSPRHRKWRAEIGVNRKNVSIGVFARFEDAVAARLEAAQRYHGEFARTA